MDEKGIALSEMSTESTSSKRCRVCSSRARVAEDGSSPEWEGGFGRMAEMISRMSTWDWRV